MIRRVVFDTNTVISALVLKSSRLGWLRAHWRERGCVPLVSSAAATELMEVIAYPKFRLAADDRNEVLADYLPYCEIVDPKKKCPTVCRDSKDQPFLDLAHAGKANVLVTGDRDLLVLAERTVFAIESPEAYRLRTQRS
jgi:uncharacterized protein